MNAKEQMCALNVRRDSAMSMFDIYAYCYANVTDHHRAWAMRQGIPHNALWRGPAAFGVARIKGSRKTFKFNKYGQRAVIVPIADSYHFDYFEVGLVDLLAFHPGDPTQWWLLRCVAPILNLEAIQRAVPCMGIDDVLVVHDTPLEWLQADQEGIVVLDRTAKLAFWLSGVQRIWCSSESLAQQLSNALSEPAQAIPEIRFPATRHVA